MRDHERIAAQMAEEGQIVQGTIADRRRRARAFTAFAERRPPDFFRKLPAWTRLKAKPQHPWS